jgi:hypothetical protein
MLSIRAHTRIEEQVVAGEKEGIYCCSLSSVTQPSHLRWQTECEFSGLFILPIAYAQTANGASTGSLFTPILHMRHATTTSGSTGPRGGP